MAKTKYKYNPDLLSYEKVKTGVKHTVTKVFTYLTASLAVIVLSYIALAPFFDTARERRLSREVEQMTANYASLSTKMDQLEVVLSDMQLRDDNIYRSVFESEPVMLSHRNSKGALERYEQLETLSNNELISDIDNRIKDLTKTSRDKTPAYKELLEQARANQEALLARPSIMPVENKDLSRTASGYGERINPIFGTKVFHKGIDFAAPKGTPVKATADGVIIERLMPETDRHFEVAGTGNRITIDHGNGWNTVYAHLDQILVKNGAKVKRGDIIGTVGSTGLSTGPHLHYEVHKNGKAINPINYFFNDLTPAKFARINDLANVGKTFD